MQPVDQPLTDECTARVCRGSVTGDHDEPDCPVGPDRLRSRAEK